MKICSDCAKCPGCSEDNKEIITNYDYIKNASLNSLAELLTDFAVDIMSKPDWYKQNLRLSDNGLMKKWLQAKIIDEKIGEIGI